MSTLQAPRIEWPAAPPPAGLPTPPPHRRPVLAALIGLLCGALATGGIWLGYSLLSPPAAGPGSDAARACAILEKLPTFTSESLARSDASELRGASDLSATAARGDQQYSRLAEATRQAYLASTDLDPAAVNEQVRTALSECG